ncbi:hypothetical protein [Duganella sp. BuS-21]|uniref:hypothetical protein n=1 Tax=Duganella sp. BuS-21 TaxID=2943848 RepID=UPI0035A5886F
MSHLTLNPESITTLVHEFYDAIRADPELGPVVNLAIGQHWTPHLARMVDFCSTPPPSVFSAPKTPPNSRPYHAASPPACNTASSAK